MATTYQPKNITELDQITPDGTETVLAAQGFAARRVTIQSIVNLVGFTQEVKDKISKIPELPIQRSELDQVKSQMIQKVDASALAPYATTAYVDQKVGSIVVPAPDLSSYATKLELQTLSTEVASKATQQNIQTLQQALNQKANSTDLTTLATKQELTQATTRIKALEDRPSASGESFSGNMGGKAIENVGQPTKPADATNKQYVDSAVAAAGENAYQRAKTYVDTRPSGSGGLSEAAVDQKISQAIQPLAKTTDLTTALSGKANASDIQSLRTELAQKADASAIPNVSSFITAAALTPYALKTDIPAVPDVSGFARRDEIPNVSAFVTQAALQPYALRSELPQIPDLSGYALKSEIPQLPDLSGYARKSELPAPVDLSGYALKSELPSVAGLVSNAELTTALAPKADRSELSGYALKTEVPSVTGLATKAELADYAKKTDIPEGQDLSQYAKKSELPSVAGLATKQELTDGLAGKVDSTALTSYARKSELPVVPDVSRFITEDALAPYAKTVDLPSVAGLETTKAVDAKLSQYVKKTELPAQQDLSVYETTAEVDRKLALKADLSAIPSLTNYATKDQIPDTSALATKEELKTYALKSEIPPAVDTSTFATNQSVDDKLSQYPKKSEIIPAPDLSTYATLSVTDSLQTQINKKVEQSYADTTYAANLTVNTKVAQCLTDAKAYTDQKVAAIGGGGGGQQQGDLSSLEAKMKLYVQSRVGGLVTNGTGLLKNNENFSQFTFDPAEAYSGFGSFKITGSNQVTTMDEVIPVDPNGTYEFSFATKVEDGTKTTKMYALVDCLDIDGSQILPMHVKTYAVTLAEDLEAASTTIKIIPDDVAKLKTAAGWRWGSGELMYIANGKYTSQSGYHYPEGTYSRNILNGAGVANNKTTLSDDGTWVIGSSLVVSETIKAGKKLIVSFDGGVYSYWMTNVRDAVLTDEWQVFTLKELMNKVLRPATATIKIGWWANRGQANTTYISNVSFRQV